MKIKERITIEDFGDKTYKVRIVESDDEKKASFTHYLHNHKNDVSPFFKKDAIGYVKGLINHDNGKTLTIILNTLREDLDYFVPEPQIINAKQFGVPQNRERLFIVGFRKGSGVTLKGRAVHFNLFAHSLQKGFPLLSLTQKAA